MSQNSRNQDFLQFFLVDRRIRIRSNKLRLRMRIQRPKNIRIRNTRTHAIATPSIWHRLANPPHKLATPALVHIGTQTLATPCMFRTHTIFTLIYTRMHFPVVNVNLAIIWFLPLVLFVRLVTVHTTRTLILYCIYTGGVVRRQEASF
jgi:hypothetical protein